MRILDLSNIPDVQAPDSLTTVGALRVQQIGNHILLAQKDDNAFDFYSGDKVVLRIVGASGVVSVDGDGVGADDAMELPKSEPVDAGYAVGRYAIAGTPKPSKRITKLAFRSRFKTAEKVAIELASLDNPSAPMQQRAIAAGLRVYLADQQVANYIDLSLPEVAAALKQLVSFGLLSADRVSEILSNDIRDDERP